MRSAETALSKTQDLILRVGMARVLLLLAAAAHVAHCITQPDRLRVLTYNVHAWRDSDHRDNFAGVSSAPPRRAPREPGRSWPPAAPPSPTLFV